MIPLSQSRSQKIGSLLLTTLNVYAFWGEPIAAIKLRIAEVKAAATGAYGNTTALVGTPEQVAESLFDYYDAGVTTLLIRGFDPVEDA
ncbi:LLM class flavin-dependent oxidoreductase [Nostoc sp. MG11]|uniref:LLM class flavin-dependent oxidoreductase n=1 Tax=Nostoc sp. MG11 TaxID=2721166 RepID=UPI001D026CCE